MHPWVGITGILIGSAIVSSVQSHCCSFRHERLYQSLANFISFSCTGNLSVVMGTLQSNTHSTNLLYSARLALAFFKMVSSLIAAIIKSDMGTSCWAFVDFVYGGYVIRWSSLIVSRKVVVSITFICWIEWSSEVAVGIESSSLSL